MEVQNNTEGNQKKWTLDATTDDNESASATTELFNGVAGPPSFMFEETKDSSKTSSSTPPRNPTKAGILIHGKQGGGSSKLDSEAGVISDAATSDGRKYHEVHEVTTGREMQLEASGDPHHQRKVSWGNDIHLGGGIPSFVQPLAASEPNLSPPLPSSSSIARRIYSEDFSTGLGSPMLSHLHQPELGSLTPTYSNDRSSVIVNLNDVLKVNPLESEAETLVLQAIERQHVTSNQEIRAGSSIRSSNLFVNIPAESVDVFSLPSVEPNVNDTESSAAKNHPRRGYVDGSVTVKTVPQAIPKPSTTRNTTMEQTLSSLTRAMASFHRGDGRDNDSTSWKGGLKAARGAGQVLVQNANLVLRVKPKSKASEDASNKFTTTAESSGEMDRLVQNESDTSGNKAAKWWCFRRHAVALTGSQNALKGHEQKAENSVVDTAAIQDDVERGTPETNESNESRCGADNNKQGRRKCCPSRKSLLEAKGLTREVKDFQIFVSQLRGPVMGYVRCFLLVTCPAMATALILFYCTDNPKTGKVDFEKSVNGILVNEQGEIIDPTKGSASWWIVFFPLTFSAAQLLQVYIIDYLCLNTKFVVTMCGNLFTVLIAMSKGWPFLALSWGVLNFALLHGPSQFASHWLYWQDKIEIFNEKNPGGTVVCSVWNTRVLSVLCGLGIAASLKRLWLGLCLGRKTYANHAEDLAEVVKKALMLCEVAALASELQSSGESAAQRALSVSQFGLKREEFDVILRRNIHYDDDTCSLEGKNGLDDTSYKGGLIVDPTYTDARRGVLDQSQRLKINELLGAWEEPRTGVGAEENISIHAILQFRQSLSCLDRKYMFSLAWGDVSTRDRMVVSSQEVYNRLLLHSPDSNQLKFETLALVAHGSNGTLDEDKLKDLIHLFRPERDGNLSLLDFVKSADVVYKEARLLRASVRNTEKIDRAFEHLFDVVFYVVILCIVLSAMGLTPLAFYLSISSLILSFAFMVGSASAKMFEGWLFILVRRPYNIGDRIHISNPEIDCDRNGSPGWIVKDVTLYHTTVVFAATGENATLSNGSLASSRVLNMARSPNAFVYVPLKFSTEVPFEKIRIFEQALRQFVQDRPREWVILAGFRATEILADQGYIGYTVSLRHREAWQNVIAVVESKAQVASFCLELSKKLEMRYQSPPLPVDLAIVGRGKAVDNESMASKFAALAADDSSGLREVAALYEKK